MCKKLVSSVFIGLLVCANSAFAVESSTQTSTVENKTPQKTKDGRISLQWNYVAQSSKEALEMNSAYLTKVQAIAKKYKITFKDFSHSYSIGQNNGYGYTKTQSLQIYYSISATFELGNLPINTIIPEFDALEYTAFSFEEYTGY